MAAADLSVINSSQDPCRPVCGQAGTVPFPMRAALEPALAPVRVEIPARKMGKSIAGRSVGSSGTSSLPLPQSMRGLHLAKDPRVKSELAWLWRTTNLTTVAAGCGLALVLHTVDSYLLSDALPLVIAGSAPHIFPPLLALLVSAFLAVLSQRGKSSGPGYYEQIAERFMLVTASFAVAWTALEWTLRLCGLSPNARKALPLEVLFTAVVLLFYAMAGKRARQHGGGNATVRDVLIVGTDAMARDVRDYLGSMPRVGYRFRGFLSTAGREEFYSGVREEIAGHVNDFAMAARAMFIDEVIVSAQQSLHEMEELCEQARGNRITLRYVPGVAESLRRSREVELVGSLPTIVAYQPESRQLALLTKRALDLVLGATALAVLSPVFLAVAIAVKLQSDGPVFYARERVGVRGRGFLCYKFRTMVRNADSLRSTVEHLNERKEILFKISNDPRVTRLGAWLRKYSLDELPQLFNVLRGEMSLVGPRPSLRAEVIQYRTAHFRRLDVKPGMTGLWQVEARSDPSFESYVALDCRYAQEWSIGLDMKILLRTVRIVFRGTGV